MAKNVIPEVPIMRLLITPCIAGATARWGFVLPAQGTYGIYVCMYIRLCMYTCIYICTYTGVTTRWGVETRRKGSMVYMCTCIYVYKYIYMCICSHMYISWRYRGLKHWDAGAKDLLRIHVYVYMCIHVYVYICVSCIYIYVCARICKYIDTTARCGFLSLAQGTHAIYTYMYIRMHISI